MNEMISFSFKLNGIGPEGRRQYRILRKMGLSRQEANFEMALFFCKAWIYHKEKKVNDAQAQIDD